MCFLYCVNIFMFLCNPMVTSVSVQIDGVIDLGSQWNYNYSLETAFFKQKTTKEIPLKGPEYNAEKVTTSTKEKKKKHKVHRHPTEHEIINDIPELRVTQYEDYYKPKKLFEKAHTVANDTRIKDFTYHVYKQSLKVFDEIRQKINPELVDRVDILSKNYDQRFRAFVKETANQKIKTRLGSQRVILNTIETSNRLLRKLVNYFIGDLKKDGMLRTNEVAINVFQKEVDRGVNLEFLHVCSKFGICRSASGFTDFLVNFLTIILKTDDSKIKQAADALTEEAKNTDFSSLMEEDTKKKFLHQVSVAENWSAPIYKAMFWITRNALAMRNLPIQVLTVGQEHVAKTVAFFEIINQLDRTIQANEENKLEWTDLENSLKDWAEGAAPHLVVNHASRQIVGTVLCRVFVFLF